MLNEWECICQEDSNRFNPLKMTRKASALFHQNLNAVFTRTTVLSLTSTGSYLQNKNACNLEQFGEGNIIIII